jgi:EAL domain-containing protein (putative c-di-GMP-specific phosphodiesterase class I)
MSLIKQLWIAIAVMMTLAFLSSFAISTFSARDYYEEQLRQKNIDSANSLALTLSQIEKDEVMIELLIAAQFDTGHYQRIELSSPSGEPLQRKIDDEATEQERVPAWFLKLAPLSISPGVAQVQDGWHQYGTLYVESQTRFAQAALWQTTRKLLLWLLLVALLCGALGSGLLKLITRPLDRVVAQAEAIGGRRFITSSEPRTLEFSRVVRAMNLLSERIRLMLETESRRLEELRYRNQHDEVTGLANRETVVSQLDALLGEEDGQHAALLVRVVDLAGINQSLGHQRTNALLRELGQVLQQWPQALADSFSDAHAGRLNGSDFLLLLTDAGELAALSAALNERLSALAGRHESQLRLLLPHGACYFHSGEQRIEVMSRVDSLLAVAEQRDATCAEVGIATGASDFQGTDGWRSMLTRTLAEQGVRAVRFPVVHLTGDALLHQEAMMRLELDGKTYRAGDFIPWARRLGLLPALDVAMAGRLLEELKATAQPQPLAINLSMETLKDPLGRQQLLMLLRQFPEQAPWLWLEFPENPVIHHIELFREFCAQVKPLGCKLGMERAGRGFARISRLQELGLDYLKVDTALTRELSGNQGNQGFLRGLCTLGHSIGLQLVADGVQSADELELLRALGFDAAGGPGISS